MVLGRGRRMMLPTVEPIARFRTVNHWRSGTCLQLLPTGSADEPTTVHELLPPTTRPKNLLALLKAAPRRRKPPLGAAGRSCGGHLPTMPNMQREMCGEPISTPALPNASAESRSHSFALERQAILPTESPSLPSCLHSAPERAFPPGLVAQCGEDDGISDLRTATKSAMRIGSPEPKMASHNNLSSAKRASILASTNSFEPTGIPRIFTP